MEDLSAVSITVALAPMRFTLPLKAPSWITSPAFTGRSKRSTMPLTKLLARF